MLQVLHWCYSLSKALHWCYSSIWHYLSRISERSESVNVKCVVHLQPSKMPTPNADGEWTVVLPRRKSNKTSTVASAVDQGKQQPWAPTEDKIDTERASKLVQKIQTCMKKLEGSRFYEVFLNQIQSPEVFPCFSRVLGSEPKMPMVIYGIGSIETYEPPRMQLSLAILMKKKFDWVGEIEVFDPVLSAIESKVLETLGCSVLSINEQGRREAADPVLFFMPHCEATLYNNLLETNWKVDRLTKIALFGNSFESYERYIAIIKDTKFSNRIKHMLAARSFADEFKVEDVEERYLYAFHESSWHFFSLEEQALPILD